MERIKNQKSKKNHSSSNYRQTLRWEFARWQLSNCKSLQLRSKNSCAIQVIKAVNKSIKQKGIKESKKENLSLKSSRYICMAVKISHRISLATGFRNEGKWKLSWTSKGEVTAAMKEYSKPAMKTKGFIVSFYFYRSCQRQLYHFKTPRVVVSFCNTTNNILKFLLLAHQPFQNLVFSFF